MRLAWLAQERRSSLSAHTLKPTRHSPKLIFLTRFGQFDTAPIRLFFLLLPTFSPSPTYLSILLGSTSTTPEPANSTVSLFLCNVVPSRSFSLLSRMSASSLESVKAMAKARAQYVIVWK